LPPNEIPPTPESILVPAMAKLPMESMSQSALLGHLLLNQQFFTQAHRKIRPDWFRDLWHSKVYAKLLQHFQYIGRHPSLAEFRDYVAVGADDEVEKRKVTAQIERSIADTQQIRLDALKPQLTDWLHSKILQEALVKSSKSWNRGAWTETAGLLRTAVELYNESKFEDGTALEFTDPENWLMHDRMLKGEALTTGLSLLDRALLDDAPSGGLQRGDTTILMAPSNTGKTTALLTMGVHNANSGKDVLVMTHEGRPEDIRLKLMKAVLDCTETAMYALYETPPGDDPRVQALHQQINVQRLRNAASVLQQRITYVPYNKAGMKVEDVVPIIRRLQQEKVSKTGKGFDLLICDYPAKLTTEQARGSLAMRSVVEIVYDFYVQLALEYNFHSLLAIQTNREGSRVNNAQNTNRLLTMEDVQEAWGPMTAASNVITLNRSPNAKKNNRITFYVAKSRSSETGRAIVARSNFAHGRTHSNELGAVGYFGTATMDADIDRFLNDPNYNNQMIGQNNVR
jgi:replicative DNA helicase